MPARALYAARLSRQTRQGVGAGSGSPPRWTIEPNRAPVRQPIRTLGSTPGNRARLDPKAAGQSVGCARLCLVFRRARRQHPLHVGAHRSGRRNEPASHRGPRASTRPCLSGAGEPPELRRAKAYSAGGGAGVPASTGTPSGRRICSVRTTLREMNEGSGGPLARSSSIAAATFRSCSVAAAKSLW